MEVKRESIKNWHISERPREKLLEKGVEALNETELLAIFIASGNREKSAIDIAQTLLKSCNYNLRELSTLNYQQLTKIKGIGPAKAATLLALFEFANRFLTTGKRELQGIRSSQYAAEVISPLLRDLPHEECWVLYLNRANKLISKERLSIGGVSSTVVDIKIVVKRALEKLASSLILVHNHPSGNPLPGEHDKLQTKLLKEAAALFDITLLDHLIIAGDDYFSFADGGLM